MPRDVIVTRSAGAPWKVIGAAFCAVGVVLAAVPGVPFLSACGGVAVPVGFLVFIVGRFQD